MSEQENITIARAFFEAWNAGDLSLNDPNNANDFMGEAPGVASPMNAEQIKMYNQTFLNAFPGSKFEILLTIAKDDYVVLHWKASGTNTGPLHTPSGATIPPTGKKATLVGSTTSLLKNGKLFRSWTFWDMTSLLGQLGMLPPM